MKFTIPCATYVRIRNASFLPGDREPAVNRPYLKSVRIEHVNGRKFIVASNAYIFVAEYLGETAEANGHVNITNNDILADACNRESEYTSNLIVDIGGGWGIATTTLGYGYPMNAVVDGNWPDWRQIIPTEVVARKYHGAACFNERDTLRLIKSAPSGEIVLPKIVDGGIPVIVRDLEYPNWLGMFLTGRWRGQAVPPSEIPDWIRRRDAIPFNDPSRSDE